MTYEWDFSVIWNSLPLLMRGLRMTLELAMIATLAGLVLGLIIGLAAVSRLAPLRWLANIYIEIFRNIPGIVQLFWFYYTIPVLTGWQGSAFVSASAALIVYASAYFAEIYRAGINSIFFGQWEGGKALGFSRAQQMRFVILPQAIRRMVPALTNRVLETVKTTTLASTIAYPELLHTAKLVAEAELRPLEAYTVVAIFFAIVLIALSYLSVQVEHHFARKSRSAT